MRFERARRGVAILVSVCLTLAPVLEPLVAIAQTPTAEQIKAFQNLPQAQRDAILQQVGAGGSAVGAAGVKAGGPNTKDAATGNQIVVQQPAIANEQAEADAKRAGVDLERDHRIKDGDQILLELVLLPPPDDALPRTPEVQTHLEELRTRLLKNNPYELTRYGVLQLPGFEPIPLAGLTIREAQKRVALEPALENFAVSVTMLRIEPHGVKALKPYGYEIFRGAANALVPGTDIPVPDDYKIGPGDTVGVQMYGQQSQTYSLPVGRDGTISFPDLGPISVGGMSFGAARSMLESRVKKQMIGAQARVSLTDLRSARVLVLGDADRPGSYVVSGLATATAALFASGGVKPIGSLRTIEIKRAGKLIRRLDLYDVLLRGDTTNDVRVETGDAVFVPPVGPTVGIDGEVRRPAIYELTKEKSVGEVIALAGGLSPTADVRAATLERIENGQDRRIFSLDLATPEGRAFSVRNGDVVRISLIRPVVDNGITVEGHVYRPGTFAYRDGMRLSDVITSIDDLKPRADLNYILVRREAQNRTRISVFSADLSAALAHRGSKDDIELNARDRITVFDLVSPREQVVAPLLEELVRQGRPDEPTGLVTIGGRVNAPGRYPLEPNMRVSDLLRAGGGLEDAAYAMSAELTRYEVVNGERRRAELREVDIAAILHGDANANFELKPYDALAIREMPEWGRVEQVTVRGEVRFPGEYRIRRGESLRSVVERAGGVTPLAFPEGAIFTRSELKIREREQLSRLADRLQRDIATLSLQASQTNPGAAQSVAAGQGLLDQLRSAKPVGRLVIDLRAQLADKASPESEVTLRDGDELIVPRLTQEVSVLGEVQNPTSHVYRPGLNRDAVIALSGGMTSRADRKRMYVVRADGSVVANSSRWMGSGNVDVRPGDTVIVPLDAESMRPLPMWTAITTIIYNLAIAAAAVSRL